MPKFCQNNFYSLKKHCALMSFFSTFSYKPPVMPIIDKKVNYVKTTVYYEPKKSKRYLFSWFLMKNSLLFSPYFFKNCPFSKKTHSSHVHILSTKSPFSQNTVLSCHFFSKFSWITPSYHADDSSKKRKFCQNYTLL